MLLFEYTLSTVSCHKGPFQRGWRISQYLLFLQDPEKVLEVFSVLMLIHYGLRCVAISVSSIHRSRPQSSAYRSIRNTLVPSGVCASNAEISSVSGSISLIFLVAPSMSSISCEMIREQVSQGHSLEVPHSLELSRRWLQDYRNSDLPLRHLLAF